MLGRAPLVGGASGDNPASTLSAPGFGFELQAATKTNAMIGGRITAYQTPAARSCLDPSAQRVDRGALANRDLPGAVIEVLADLYARIVFAEHQRWL